MFKKITASFILALHNIRSHFFHTILSLLGIVIGVASLVAILSMIDGMEQYAKDQISQTTSIKVVVIQSNAFLQRDGVIIRKDSTPVINYADYLELKSSLTLPATAQLFVSTNRVVSLEGDTSKIGTYTAATAFIDTTQSLLYGRKYYERDQTSSAPVAVLSESLAKSLAKDETLASLIGRKVKINDERLTIIGIVKHATQTHAALFMPVAFLKNNDLKNNPPTCTIEAENVEDVTNLKKEIEEWITKRYGSTGDFRINTNEARVDQATKGFMLFRLIMGLIVGISVLVGGIGVMNVLLISVTERTAEIGVRKAVGANKRDIILQFLSESITISLFGSFIGLVIGISGTMVMVPVVKSLTGIPFYAAYTWNTFFIISILAVVVGVVFGTYPAIRAARLDPVEAIRRE